MKIFDLKKLKKVRNDDRGWIAQVESLILDQGCEIKNIHVGIILPSQIRGNHFHNKLREWTMVMGGKYIFSWEENEKILKKEINENEICVFEFEPGEVHAVKNISDSPIYICSFGNIQFNPEEPDTFRKVII
jgi:dTDP-4-dehydrorhamnose 3,5-epimerase-like enzyme